MVLAIIIINFFTGKLRELIFTKGSQGKVKLFTSRKVVIYNFIAFCKEYTKKRHNFFLFVNFYIISVLEGKMCNPHHTLNKERKREL